MIWVYLLLFGFASAAYLVNMVMVMVDPTLWRIAGMIVFPIGIAYGTVDLMKEL